MADDFSALELDIDQDEELSALFGTSAQAVPSSTQHNKLTSTQAQPLRPTRSGVNVPPTFHQHSQSQQQTQSLLCSTNKRPAASLNQSWPNTARQPTPPASCVDVNTAYADLELDSWEPDHAAMRQAKSSTNRQNNTSISRAAAPTVSSQVPAGITSRPQAQSNTDSQATELWQSAYSRPLQASQASVSVQRASTSQQTAEGHWPAAAPAAPRHLSITSHEPDISAGMVRICQQSLHLKALKKRVQQDKSATLFFNPSLCCVVPVQQQSDNLCSVYIGRAEHSWPSWSLA